MAVAPFSVRHGLIRAFSPMSLCSLEGAEGGMNIDLGKNPRKWPKFFDVGAIAARKACIFLEPWQDDASRKSSSTRKERRAS